MSAAAPETDAPETERILARAAALVGAPLASASMIRQGLRSGVWRCVLDGPEAHSVVVKSLDPESHLGLTDWASLAFLGSLPETSGLVPSVLAGDPADRVLVLEDLGDSRSLETLLRESDSSTVVVAIGALGEAYGQLHTGTQGREDAFGATCAAIPGAMPPGRDAEAEAWLDGLSVGVGGWAAAVRVGEPAGFGAACEAVAGRFAEPGPFLAFGHGDPAPTNNHVGADPGEVRLLDFEYGAYRHALYDLAAWEVLCPLPRPLVSELVGRYRAVAPADDEEFASAWAAMIAYRTFAILSWMPTSTLDEDAPWVGTWTRRMAIVAAVSRLAEAAVDVADLAPIAALAGSLAAALRASWPEIDPDPVAFP